jgi:hypothetical protein
MRPEAPTATRDSDEVAVTIKFSREAHARLKQHARDYGKRKLAHLVAVAVNHVLDELDAGRPPADFAESRRCANPPEGGGA